MKIYENLLKKASREAGKRLCPLIHDALTELNEKAKLLGCKDERFSEN